MVEKIVLVIDRDNDLGFKAGIKSPVVGRQSNLISAIKLAEVDPEDSDVNTIFGAIKIYDELKREGEDVEIVTVCGDQRVGTISDEKIAEQLDFVKEKLKAESVIIVTDGSEDEFVIPIVASRFKIDGIRRIVVKQSKTLESTYYLMKKLLEDPKIAKSTLTPLGMILLVYAISLFMKSPEFGVGSIAFVLGIYFLIKAYGLEGSLENYFSTLKRSLIEGRFSFVTYVIALISFIIGLVYGAYRVWLLTLGETVPGIVTIIAVFLNSTIVWIVAGGIFVALGRIFDSIVEGRSCRKYVTMVFLVSSTGLVVWGFSKFFIDFKSYLDLIKSIVGAIILGVVGVVPLRYEGGSSKRRTLDKGKE